MAEGTCCPCPKSTSISLLANPETKLLLPLLTCDLNMHTPCCQWFENAKSRVQPQNIEHPTICQFLRRMDFGKGYIFLQYPVSEGLQTTTPTVYTFPPLYLTLVALLTTLRATRPRTAVRFPVWTRKCSRFGSAQTKPEPQPAECKLVRA
jgi:hypothetical protein